MRQLQSQLQSEFPLRFADWTSAHVCACVLAQNGVSYFHSVVLRSVFMSKRLPEVLHAHQEPHLLTLLLPLLAPLPNGLFHAT